MNCIKRHTGELLKYTLDSDIDKCWSYYIGIPVGDDRLPREIERHLEGGVVSCVRVEQIQVEIRTYKDEIVDADFGIQGTFEEFKFGSVVLRVSKDLLPGQRNAISCLSWEHIRRDWHSVNRLDVEEELNKILFNYNTPCRMIYYNGMFYVVAKES